MNEVNNTEERIEIHTSKAKLLFPFISSLVFVALGIFFIFRPNIFADESRTPEFVLIMGYISVIFFGLAGVMIGRRIVNSQAGVIISKEGLIIELNRVSTGLIPWSGIEKFSMFTIFNQKLIMVHVEELESYLEKQPSKFRRKIMKANYKRYGAPFSIAASSLKLSPEELLNLLTNYLYKMRQLQK